MNKPATTAPTASTDTTTTKTVVPTKGTDTTSTKGPGPDVIRLGDDEPVRKFIWFQCGDTRLDLANTWQHINMTFAVQGPSGEFFNTVWRAESVPRSVTIMWKPKYAISWVRQAPAHGRPILPERQWFPLELGQAAVLGENGYFQLDGQLGQPAPSGKAGAGAGAGQAGDVQAGGGTSTGGKPGDLQVGGGLDQLPTDSLNVSQIKWQTPHGGVHIVLGIWSDDVTELGGSEHYKVFYADPAPIGYGNTRVSYKPLQKAYWWLDNTYRESRFLDLGSWKPEKDAVIMTSDLARPLSPGNWTWYSTFDKASQPPWSLSSRAPPLSVLDVPISGTSYPIEQPALFQAASAQKDWEVVLGKAVEGIDTVGKWVVEGLKTLGFKFKLKYTGSDGTTLDLEAEGNLASVAPARRLLATGQLAQFQSAQVLADQDATQADIEQVVAEVIAAHPDAFPAGETYTVTAVQLAGRV